MSIEFKEVSHSYEKRKKNNINVDAIKNINLTIDDKDEFVFIVGGTGAGKSTMLQHINGLLLPTDGVVQIGDLVLSSNKRKNPKLKEVRKKIGFVFQFPEYQLFEETVFKDIIYGPLNFGFSLEEASKQAKKIAEKLKISDILDKSPFNLSGGQMRKVAIAGILAYNPDVLLLDEPTRGLDPLGANEIMEFFDELNKGQHKTIIMISHDMNLVYRYAKRVIVLGKGEILFDGKKEDLFSGLYQKYSLDKPNILKSIDFLNEKLNLNISYYNYTLEDLLTSLRDGDLSE